MIILISVQFQSLSDKLERLKSENKDLEDRLSMSWPMSGLSPHSPRPLSPTSSIDGESVLSSSGGSSLFEEMEQLQFDKNESQAKYDEMKVCHSTTESMS